MKSEDPRLTDEEWTAATKTGLMALLIVFLFGMLVGAVLL